jgi:hypothetical protein
MLLFTTNKLTAYKGKNVCLKNILKMSNSKESTIKSEKTEKMKTEKTLRLERIISNRGELILLYCF